MNTRAFEYGRGFSPAGGMGALALALAWTGLCMGCAAAHGQSSDVSPAQSQTPNQPADADSPAPSDPSDARTDADPQAVAFLDRLERRLERITSFQAALVYTAEQPLLGDKQTRIGRVSYVAGPPARFNVTFEQLLIGQALRPRRRSYIFDGTWLVERYPREKLFIKRQVVAPGESFDPLKLGQGPFPLPLGQKRDEVVGRFKVDLISAPDLAPDGQAVIDADSPAHAQPADQATADRPDAQGADPPAWHLRLTPRLDPGTGKPIVDFQQVDIWYDAATLIPRQVRAVEASNQIKTVRIRDVQLDALEADDQAALFDTTAPAPGSGWRVEIKPWRPDQPSTGPAPKPRSDR